MFRIADDLNFDCGTIDCLGVYCDTVSVDEPRPICACTTRLGVRTLCKGGGWLWGPASTCR